MSDQEAASKFVREYPGAMGRGALHDAFLAGAKHGREQEREACAELCQDQTQDYGYRFADMIRARGDQ